MRVVAVPPPPCFLRPLRQDSDERQNFVDDEVYPNPSVERASKKTPRRRPVRVSI